MTVPDMDIENLLVRAQYLGDHAVLYNNINAIRMLGNPCHGVVLMKEC